MTFVYYCDILLIVRILPEPIVFEWDKGNSGKNLIKHEVRDKEAEEVFNNKPLISKDIQHSKKELRFQALGRTDKGRLIFLSFTIRKDKIRVISARNMNKKEVLKYEKT